MRIGIIVAMDKELQLLRELLPSAEAVDMPHYKAYRAALTPAKELVITQCGIGKVHAALGTAELIDRSLPDCIISTGVAGAAQPDIATLTVVAAAAVAYHDVYCGSEGQPGQVLGLPPAFPAAAPLVHVAEQIDGVRIGLIASGDWFVDSRAKAQEILAVHPTAVAFDMESGAIAQTCFLRTCPFLSFRTISDNPLSGASPAQYDDFWARLSQGSLDVLIDFLHRL